MCALTFASQFKLIDGGDQVETNEMRESVLLWLEMLFLFVAANDINPAHEKTMSFYYQYAFLFDLDCDGRARRLVTVSDEFKIEFIDEGNAVGSVRRERRFPREARQIPRNKFSFQQLMMTERKVSAFACFLHLPKNLLNLYLTRSVFRRKKVLSGVTCTASINIIICRGN